MATKSKGSNTVDVHVYLEPDLAAAIRASAEQNGRSFQREIRYALRERYAVKEAAAE